MDEVPVRVRLREHAKQICSLTDRILKIVLVQHVLVSQTVCMRVRLHLELEVFNIPEAERAMPAYLWSREILINIRGTLQSTTTFFFCSNGNCRRSELGMSELEKRRGK